MGSSAALVPIVGLFIGSHTESRVVWDVGAIIPTLRIHIALQMWAFPTGTLIFFWEKMRICGNGDR